MYPMPPPMYDPNAAMPPTYAPPMGGSKVDPSQWRENAAMKPAEGEPTPVYTPPVSAPPPVVQANHTGMSNNPYR